MAKENEATIKRAVISGASKALRYRDKNPRAPESEIIQKIVDELREIIREIDRE